MTRSQCGLERGPEWGAGTHGINYNRKKELQPIHPQKKTTYAAMRPTKGHNLVSPTIQFP